MPRIRTHKALLLPALFCLFLCTRIGHAGEREERPNVLLILVDLLLCLLDDPVFILIIVLLFTI